MLYAGQLKRSYRLFKEVLRLDLASGRAKVWGSRGAAGRGPDFPVGRDQKCELFKRNMSGSPIRLLAPLSVTIVVPQSGPTRITNLPNEKRSIRNCPRGRAHGA
jgi:hypothetical protein